MTGHSVTVATDAAIAAGKRRRAAAEAAAAERLIRNGGGVERHLTAPPSPEHASHTANGHLATAHTSEHASHVKNSSACISPVLGNNSGAVEAVTHLTGGGSYEEQAVIYNEAPHTLMQLAMEKADAETRAICAELELAAAHERAIAVKQVGT